MQQNMNHLKSQNKFREPNRFGSCGTLSNELNTINAAVGFLTIKSLRLFCVKISHYSKNLPQSVTIMGLEPRYFHV